MFHDFWEAGYRIFPLYGIDKNGKCECGHENCDEKSLLKHPRQSGWQNLPMWDDEQMANMTEFKWFDSGYGVLCDGSLLIIDVDARNGGIESFKKFEEKYPAVSIAGLEVVTGSGGGSKHVYFSMPEPVSMVQSHHDYPGLDFKSSGFVVGPGSLHASGRRYMAEGYPQDITPAPQEIVDFLRRPERHRNIHNGQIVELSHQDIANMLRYIDGESMHYDHWVEIGMAIHHATQGTGYDIWVGWSKQFSKHDETRMPTRWHSFRGSADPVTVGTIYYKAQAGGWQQSVTFEPEQDALHINDRDACTSEKARPSNVNYSDSDTNPFNLWETQEPPEIPEGVLPAIIENFARVTGKSKGIDPGGIVMACLTACAGVITDKIEIKVKRNEDWRESARIWTMLIGDPSYKKSPMIKAGAKKLAKIDAELIAKYNHDLAHWEEMGKKGLPPQPKRIRINDTTIEAAQEVCGTSPDGIICVQDELSGWFGAIEKYSGGKGSAKDRSFWLQAFGGGSYAVDRIGRKSTLVENLSISILGGVQPDPIRKIVHEATDDGLIQRFFPIVLQPSMPDEDDECEDVDTGYNELIDTLYAMKPIDSVLGSRPLQFDDVAQVIRRELAAKHHKSVSAIERINKKLAAHIGKFDGLFPRLCIIWHCIEHAVSNPDAELPPYVTGDTAKRVSIFLSQFLMRHSLAFYSGILGLADDHSELQDVGGYILAHKIDYMTQRRLQRGSRAMRKLTREQGARIFEQLEAFGWVEQASKRADAPRWDVNPKVHELYEAQAHEERERREEGRAAIMELISSSRDSR